MKSKSLRILGVAAGGGHLTELNELMAGLDPSYNTIKASPLPSGNTVDPSLFCLPGYTVWNVYAIFKYSVLSLILLFRFRPHVIISTGSESCLPFILFGKVCLRTRVIYVECSAQVQTPSLTGRIVYHLADRFYVQWPSLLSAYGPKARFVGGFLCCL